MEARKRQTPLAGGVNVKTISDNASHILAGMMRFALTNPAPTSAVFTIAVQQVTLGILMLIGGRA